LRSKLLATYFEEISDALVGVITNKFGCAWRLLYPKSSLHCSNHKHYPFVGDNTNKGRVSHYRSKWHVFYLLDYKSL